MKVSRLFYLLLFSFLSSILTAQVSENESVKAALSEYYALVKTGRLKEAVSCLSGLLNSNHALTPTTRLAINNNLGIQNKNLGQYDIALKYYDEAESIYLNNGFTQNSFLISIYGNKVNIYLLKGDFNKALEYNEKAIRSVSYSSGDERPKQLSISSLYLNAGIIYFQLNDFAQALSAFQKSLFLKDKYNLPEKDLLYKQLANTYAKTGNKLLADKYFNLSIRHSEAGSGSSSATIAQIYLDYGIFLLANKEQERALSAIQKALKINLKSLGEKSQLTSNCYQLMGDYYRIIRDFSNALSYYQKTLVSGSKDFNDLDFEANPSIKEITVNLWQLRVLLGKADALAGIADEVPDKAEKIKKLSLSLNTKNLAIEMTNQIRVDYQDEETRLMFNANQKNVYSESIETALKLYNLTSEKSYLYQAYQTAQRSKANELKYEIARNKSFSNKEIPDSLQNKERKIQNNIAAYNTLIRNESALSTPDTTKLAYWKDQQFNLNRSLEKTVETIERDYPRFTDKLKRGNIVDIEKIQSNLKPDKSLIEYVFSGADEKGVRKLFEFVITPTDLICHSELIDSTMYGEFSGIKMQLINQLNKENSILDYNNLNQRLFRAYTVLIEPIKKYFYGTQLIIIPDEELSHLPFDAFLTSWQSKTRINYASLAYLIRDYSISYGYSINTLWGDELKGQYWPKVIGFAPDYPNSDPDDKSVLRSLKDNNIEIESILKNFNGISFSAGKATLSGFRANLKSNAILHLAMHAELDTLQAGSSSLVFTPDSKDPRNCRLYNYEIGQLNIKSPLVVLSACNTGNGKLYSGEGLLSLARSFILAGVPSVVETLWPVQDVASSKIMGDFYKHLSEGDPKNTALRLAKLDYINNTSPSFVDPRFWAAYTLAGDVSAIKRFWWKEPWFLTSMALLISMLTALLVYRLRFLRIS